MWSFGGFDNGRTTEVDVHVIIVFTGWQTISQRLNHLVWVLLFQFPRARGAAVYLELYWCF